LVLNVKLDYGAADTITILSKKEYTSASLPYLVTIVLFNGFCEHKLFV
jgi:hypothetical protein